MAIKVVDLIKLGRESKKRVLIMDTKKMHSWILYLPNPGDTDDMHCHPGDQTFTCLEGECTLHFPDGGKSVLPPGSAAFIEGGSFYRQENSGSGPLILMGTRTGPHSSNQHINYETGEDTIHSRVPRHLRTDSADNSPSQ